MKTTIIGKNMNVSPAVSSRVLRKTEKMGRYLGTKHRNGHPADTGEKQPAHL